MYDHYYRAPETTRPPHLALFVSRYSSVWETTDRLSNNNNRNMRILAACGQDPVLIRSFFLFYHFSRLFIFF